MECCAQGCAMNGCFSHVSVLCLGWEFGASRNICECTCPGFSYLRAPGQVRTEICLQNCSKASPSGDGAVPLDVQCMSNLYVCSCAFGQYNPPPFEVPPRNRTVTSPPQVQEVSKTAPGSPRASPLRTGKERPPASPMASPLATGKEKPRA